MSKFSENQKGPSIIINGGNVADLNIAEKNKFGKYALKYNVGWHNESLLALREIIKDLAKLNKAELERLKMPWRIDEVKGIISLTASSRKRPHVVDKDKRIVGSNILESGDFCKINVTPLYYSMTESSSYIVPGGERRVNTYTKEGVSLMLNGIMIMNSSKPLVEDLF